MAKCFGVSVYLEGMPLLAVQGTTRILVFGVNKDAYASSYLLQGVAEICSMIRGLDDWLGWACSFPATGPGPGWCLDTEVGAVMVFFFLHISKGFQKRKYFQCCSELCSWTDVTSSKGAVPLPATGPLRARLCKLCSATLASNIWTTLS